MMNSVSMTFPLGGPYRPAGDHGWMANAAALAPWADSIAGNSSFPISVLENGQPRGPAHAAHADIRKQGGGRFSLWNDGNLTNLYFSTFDGSNPNTNDRRYEICITTSLKDISIRPRSASFQFDQMNLMQQKEHIDQFFIDFCDTEHWSRDKFYHAEEYLLSRLIGYLGKVQGGSVRHLNIADQYVRAAQRHLPTLASTTVVEIGPGNNLGNGIIFRYLGAEKYYGVELYTGPDFNTSSTLSSMECLVRLKYGQFLDNFLNVPLGFVPPGSLDATLDLATSGVELLRQQSLSTIELPEESVDYVFSNFVFEHIQEPSTMIAEIARVLRPGGVTAHFVDIEDHSNFHAPHTYLRFPEAEWESRYAHAGGNIPSHLYENRLRASDFRNAFENAGLEVVEFNCLRRHPLSDRDIAGFDTRWRRYEKADLETVWLFLIARKRTGESPSSA